MNFGAIVKNCNCWNDFRRAISDLTTKEKGDAFERLVQMYLTLEPMYVSKLKHVWRLSEVPQTIVEKLNLPARDLGIDVVCETHEGEYWAVQVKYREDESKSLTWSELSTFSGLAFGICSDFSFGLICSTADRITETLQRLPQVGFCTGEVWRKLDAPFFDLVRFAERGDYRKPAAYEPRDHQRRAIENAEQHFVIEDASRGKMIWPCGTGKSLAAYWIAEKLDARRVVVVVPSLALIRQSLRTWLYQTVTTGREAHWICVCSDESAGKISRDDVAVLSHDLGIPCMTDSDRIREWLSLPRTGRIIVFVTYQSGETLCKATSDIELDLGVFDEAHKTAGAKGKPFAQMLFNESISIKRRLFMTATERRYTGKHDDVVSMDNPDVYGETFDFMSFKEAIVANPPILSDYRVLLIAVSQSDVEQLIRSRAVVAPDAGSFKDDIEADTLASLIALRSTMADGRVRRAITFHSSIARAKRFAEHNDDISAVEGFDTEVEVYHVSGAMPTSTRDRITRQFEAARKSVITNARCLTEGVDIPVVAYSEAFRHLIPSHSDT